MKAIRPQTAPVFPLRKMAKITSVPTFVHFGANRLKVQVCSVPPGEQVNHSQIIFTRGAFALVCLRPGQRIEFRFQKSTMFQQTIHTYFTGGFFELYQACILSNKLARQLDKNSLCLKKGVYPVTETKEELIVTF